ncbi:MAG: hypothetical protein HY329_02645 [Chloroflexi bacterium]|nr:hypothetical protein [Chloroflexota bacterium]
MAVLKTDGTLSDPVTGAIVGRGRAFLSLPGGGPIAGGTMSGLTWTGSPATAGARYRLTLADGRTLGVRCTRAGPTDCGTDVLRFLALQEAESDDRR